jgi:CelD/BcsL family acetyltransferase involved in cellulose biosynthesis
MAMVVQGTMDGIRDGAAGTVPSVRDMLTAEILPGLGEAEALWRSLETSPECLATPYQRFDWCAAYLTARQETALARVAVLRDATGRARMLVPLVLRLEYGLVVAHSVGDDHANYHLPLFASRDAGTLASREVRTALGLCGRQAGIDVYAFTHQPRVWEGMANPLAAGGDPEESAAYGLLLGPDPEATSRRLFSGDARKKLRSKEKRLVEALGAVEVRRAGTPQEARDVLTAFYRQKAARFAAMGIADPYAPREIRAFLEEAAGGDALAMEVHALHVVATGRILAVFGGAVNGSRYSGMMTSFDMDPEIGRFSPGDLLLYHLVRDQTERGRTGFDLGIGEARYKASICDETIELVRTLVPVTGRGHVFAMTRLAFLRLKRRIKGSPRLFAMASRLRDALSRG